MKIPRELWQQIEPMFTDALEMDPGAREAWLSGLDNTHPQLSPALRKLLATHDRAERLRELETVPRLAPPPPPSSGFANNQLIGPFKLLKQIGRCGIGEVWLAEQTDGRVERQVALKLPTIYLHSDVWRERFRRERNILAKLNHPHIAKLYDAGVSEAEGSKGQPYLAMEFVEGESFAEYVNTRKLTLTERLKLFRQVLEAVAHAHRHLVVHRDLKPANILIDKSGQVKLLDFGIAKLIDDETHANTTAALTQLGGRVMTLRYAAPEQVADAAISTATDVYALGVILHEMVTGLSPYRAVREGKPLTETALLAEQISVPSSLPLAGPVANERGLANSKQLARALSGDLDAIILKALRQNPADRYATVEQFDADILRHLENRPVNARAGTWRYLAGRFAARNKLPITAAAAVLLTMIAGLVMVEQQRRIAVNQRERAEGLFNSVRSLANSLIFDVHDKIEELPGSTQARHMLVENASKYLQQLSSADTLDDALRTELAQSYIRLANIQGAVDAQNVGKPDEALQSYQRAVALLMAVASTPAPPAGGLKSGAAAPQLTVARALVYAYRKMSALQSSMGKRDEAYASAKLGAEVAERASAMPGANLADRLEAAKLRYERERRLAGLTQDREIRLKAIAEAVASVELLRIDAPTDATLLEDLAWLYSENGHALRGDPKPEVKREAIKKYQAALAIREASLRNNPDNVSRQRSIVAHHNAIGTTYAMLGENAAALVSLTLANESMIRLAARDPDSVQYQLDIANSFVALTEAQLAAGDANMAIRSAEAGLKRLRTLPSGVRGLPGTRQTEAGLLRRVGEAYFAIVQRADAPARQRTLVAARDAFVAMKNSYSLLAPRAGIDESQVKDLAIAQQHIDAINAQLAAIDSKR